MKKEDIIELLGITIGIVVLTRIFYPCIQNLFSIPDGYSAATLTSSLLMAIVTAIYVRYTYRIFDATNKNTEQTANAQKITLLERKLELFYLPLNSLLNKYNPTKIENEVGAIREGTKIYDTDKELVGYYNKLIIEFTEDDKKIVPYDYLASSSTLEYYRKFSDVFYEKDFANHMIKDYRSHSLVDSTDAAYAFVTESDYAISYNILKKEVYNDINKLKANLAELVNL